MEANWIPRRNRSQPKRNTIYIHSLHTTVEIDEYEVTCGVCNKLLDGNFVTLPCYHSTCEKCLEGAEGTYTCPKCNTDTPITTHKDPVIDEVMKHYPRAVPCGTTCNGWVGAKEHEELCVLCAKMVKRDLQFEVASLKFVITNQENQITSLETSNVILKKELGKFLAKYGPMVDEEEESQPIL